MEKEFKSLSEELDNICNNQEFRDWCEDWKHVQQTELERYIYWSKIKTNYKVKEFIRLLKEEIHTRAKEVFIELSEKEIKELEKEEKSLLSIIDKLAGPDLITEVKE